MKKASIKTLMFGCVICLVILFSIVIKNNWFHNQTAEQVKASTIESKGDFRLTAENRWNSPNKKNYAELNWQNITNLSNGGYQLYQSENGTNWTNKSLMYGKAIKVLNIYPDIAASNTLKGWMDGLGLKDKDGNNLINVTAVNLTAYNANPTGYLLDSSGNYQYDVVMFGSWDWNNHKDMTEKAVTELQKFIDTGRGVLYGHDTITGNSDGILGRQHIYFNRFASQLGITTFAFGGTGSTKVKINNNGYLMKYPFELADSVTLTVPISHSYGEKIDASEATIWLEYTNISWGSVELDGNKTTNFYLATKGNVGKIQTGHSNGASTIDERKIIANTLYNLAQVSLDNFAEDHTVKDDQAPKSPEMSIRCGIGGESEKLNIKVNAEDKGKKYYWYVDANKKDNTMLKSDTVSEVITSNTAGYFYEVSDSPTSNLKATVEGYKDEYGRIPEEKYDIYVAPDSEATTYETTTAFTIEEKRKAGRYLHVLAVDRANNISEVSTQELNDLTQLVDYEVERNQDEAKIVDLDVDSSLESKIKSMEVQLPKNSEIKDYVNLNLPDDWYAYENSEGTDYRSFTFATPSNNSNAQLTSFLKSLRVTLKDPIDQSGDIRILLKERIYTSRKGEDGKVHYYTMATEPAKPTWLEAYNLAQGLTYKGLTGYLATVTSEEENNFIYNNIGKKSGWLGGTRLANKTTNQKINNEKNISEDFDKYNQSADKWYWANGPEAGCVFYNTKKYNNSGPVSGVYNNFNNPRNSGNGQEPNNAGSFEQCLEFATPKSAGNFWNDLRNKIEAPYYQDSDIKKNINSYYVEFSEYGDQIEGEELSDSCWTAPIPQKVYVQGYTDKGSTLAAGDVVYEENLRIGKKVKLAPKEIDAYEFLQAVHADDTVNDLNYTIKAQVQTGDKNIYGYRKVIAHLRQVINGATTDLVVPSEGYGALISKNSEGNDQQRFNITMPSSKQNTVAYRDVEFLYQGDNHFIGYQEVQPMNYELLGYVVTTNATPHQPTMATTNPVKIDVDGIKEIWVTIYLKAVTNEPTPYHWEYKNNDLGTMKVN